MITFLLKYFFINYKKQYICPRIVENTLKSNSNNNQNNPNNYEIISPNDHPFARPLEA